MTILYRQEDLTPTVQARNLVSYGVREYKGNSISDTALVGSRVQ